MLQHNKIMRFHIIVCIFIFGKNTGSFPHTMYEIGYCVASIRVFVFFVHQLRLVHFLFGEIL